MKVDQDLCIGCEACIPYCPARAIYMNEDYKAFVNLDLCYECGVCEMVKVCPVDALSFGELPEE
ncbi:MAG TPA: 4Fe-4S binding protein, partial [Clostridia bacterium]|nr:4Fe-4S binding protein [Clostridia bacterium]